MHHTSVMSTSNVPAFLTKLWALVENSNCDDLICWDESGNSFHVYEQARFSKEILPLYFKHSNIASFIRQLNMYGFRKVVHIDTGLKTEKDDVEFQHVYFIKGHEDLLENIKRKISGTSVPLVKSEGPSVFSDVSKVLTDVVVMKGKQDNMSSRLDTVKRENDLLWREVASLRQKHIKQQQIVNKLIQFLVHMVGGNRGLSGMKRKMGMPLMIGGKEEPATKLGKYNKSSKSSQIYSVQSPAEPSSTEFPDKASGVVIHDVTDVVRKGEAQTAKALTTAESRDIVAEASASSSNNVSLAESLSLPEDITSLGSDLLDNMQMFSEGMYPDMTDTIPEMYLSSDLLTTPPTNTAVASPPLSYPVKQVSNSTSVPSQKPPVHALTRQPSVSEMSDHLDDLQLDLEHVKDALSGTQYTVDPSFLLGLFNPESPVTISPDMLFNPESPVTISPEMLFGEIAGITPTKEEDPNRSNYIVGNEVIQYKPSDDAIPDLFDLADLSQAEDDPLSNSTVDTFKLKALQTPYSQVSSDELDID